jgi:hypothetical protein
VSADLLKRAAKVLRSHATIATSSHPAEPWTAFQRDHLDRHIVCVELRWRDEGDAMPGGYRIADMSLDAPAEGWPLGQAVVDSQYIALMHPPVALALADWLDEIVADHEINFPYQRVFALARAILRESS